MKYTIAFKADGDIESIDVTIPGSAAVQIVADKVIIRQWHTNGDQPIGLIVDRGMLTVPLPKPTK